MSTRKSSLTHVSMSITASIVPGRCELDMTVANAKNSTVRFKGALDKWSLFHMGTAIDTALSEVLREEQARADQTRKLIERLRRITP